MRVVGIDYSIRCPAVCIFETNEAQPQWYPENCQVHFLTEKKKHCYRITPNVMGHYMPLYREQDDTDRFSKISDWALGLLKEGDIIGIEDYAFSAQGMVYKIGENTGLLKYKLWSYKFQFECIMPSKIKKFFVSHGAADKTMMYNAFVQETGWNLDHHIKSRTRKITSPLSDIADSFAICKYVFCKANTHK